MILFHDAGCQGRISDGGVWANSKFCKDLKNGKLKIPKGRALPKPTDPLWGPYLTDEKLAVVIVGDNAVGKYDETVSTKGSG